MENNEYFFIYNHVKVCSALHLDQHLFHAIKTWHISTYVQLCRYLIMLEVIILMKIHGFKISDTTRLWRLEISFNGLILCKF